MKKSELRQMIREEILNEVGWPYSNINYSSYNKKVWLVLHKNIVKYKGDYNQAQEYFKKQSGSDWTIVRGDTYEVGEEWHDPNGKGFHAYAMKMKNQGKDIHGKPLKNNR